MNGVFAMQNGRARTEGHLVASPIGTSPLYRHLDLWLTRGPLTLRRYDTDMTKLLHLIAIGDDFTTFEHLHPVFGADGHFRIDARFPKQGLYHVYSDSEPTRIGRQVFRYDFLVGSRSSQTRNIAATGSQVEAGPYRVTIDSTHLHIATENELTVRITEHRMPAKDLHPYLGALAHAVFIDAGDLSYAHVHPVPLSAAGKGMMSGMSAMDGMAGTDIPQRPGSAPQRSSPNMQLHVVVRKPGTYKLWLQFLGKDGLHVAPFVVTAA